MKHFGATSCIITPAVLIFLSLSPAKLWADGLLQQLPSEGTAVKYKLSRTGTLHIFESGMGDRLVPFFVVWVGVDAPKQT